MRKMKLGSLILLLISVAIFGGYKIYEFVNRDTKPPVVQCSSEEMTVAVDVTEEELLKDVTAKDNKSGDVSDTLVIEKISSFTGENTRIVTYAAIDEKGNMGRCERTLKYENYKKPYFSLSEPLRFPMGRDIDLLECVSAQSVLDGDLTSGIKYTLDGTIDLGNPGVYQIEYRVTDSCGYVAYLPIEVEVYDRTEERIEVVLSEYLVYVPINASFHANDYYVGSNIDGTLSIQSGVDTQKAGIYYVDYIVSSANSMGKSRLVVVVTES